MNNFDDLFEQQPQKEAAPQKPEGQKERSKRQWWQIREEKQRKEAYASLDKIFGAFAEGNGNIEAYLDVQSPVSLPLCPQRPSDRRTTAPRRSAWAAIRMDCPGH